MKYFHSLCLFLILAGILFLWTGCENNITGFGSGVGNTNYLSEQSFSFDIELSTQARFNVRGINGNITITGKAGFDSILITGVRRVHSESTADADSHMQYLAVRMFEQSDEIFAETVQPQNSGGRIYEVEYHILVPVSIPLKVSNVNGDITTDRMTSDVTVNNENGVVYFAEYHGNCIVNLTNGNIFGDYSIPDFGYARLTLVNGNIDIHIPQSTSAYLNSNVTNGQIVVSDLNLQDVLSSSTFLRGRLGSGRGTITLSVTNGDISVSGT